jgi:triacylglycerol esterase/lipase EstA (alpha/beta hydrolase family)
MRVRSFVAAVAAAACVITAAAVSPPAAAAAPAPAASSAGAPVQAGSRGPVIIVEGTGSGPPLLAILDYSAMAERLRADGYQPYVFRLPGRGLGDIAETSAGLVPFVDRVLAETGASKVDLIGHSQGGIVSRYYIKFLGGESKVDSLVSLGAPHYGSQIANLAMLHGVLECLGYEFCQQVVTGSDFLRRLNGDDDTFGSVAYTNIETALDLIVLPYTNAFQRSPGAVNVTIQNQCPLRVVEHLLLAVDGTTYSGIQDALARQPIRLNCLAL